MKKYIVLFITAFCFSSATHSLAQAPNTPLDTVKTVYLLLKKYNANSPTKEKDRSKINNYFMLNAMAQDAIADHWPTMTPPQKKKYMILMYKLLLKTVYDDTGDKIQKGYYTIRGSHRIGNTRTMVLTTITIVKSDMKVANDFALLKVGSTWKIRSIFIDNANIATDYKSQFNQIITKYGIEGTKDSLLERIDDATKKSNDWTKVNSDGDDSSSDTKEVKKEVATKRPTLLEE